MENSSVHRREKIVSIAVDLIHESGIHSVSTKAIAKRMGISEGTIFNHFPKKKDLLMAVLEQFSLYDHDVFHTALNKKLDAKGAILFYIDSYLTYYENYPEITALLQAYDVLRGVPELEEKSKGIFEIRLYYMQFLIKEAQRAGIISSEADSEILADIFTSTFRGICIRWRMSNCGFSLREKTMQAVMALLNAFNDKQKIQGV